MSRLFTSLKNRITRWFQRSLIRRLLSQKEGDSNLLHEESTSATESESCSIQEKGLHLRFSITPAPEPPGLPVIRQWLLQSASDD